MTNSKEFSLNHELVLELELGDIVEFPRENYSHFGIYVGMYSIFNLIKSLFKTYFINKNIGHKYSLANSYSLANLSRDHMA